MAARSQDVPEATTDYVRVRDDGPTHAASTSGVPLRTKVLQSRGVDSDDLIPSKVPATDGNFGFVQRLVSKVRQNKGLGVAAAIAAVLLVALLVANRKGGLFSTVSDLVDHAAVDWNVDLNVAFIGGSYFYVNDIPRLMEAISDGHIHQDSVIHSSAGSLPDMLMRGNGMYYAWRTDKALMAENYYYGDHGDDSEAIYDYGLCTVAQIMYGYDEILTYGNNDNAYINDYKNPCIVDEGYYEYETEHLQYSNVSMTERWDYIVLVDQTKRMAVAEAKEESIYALKYGYGPLLAGTGAIPVLVDTHAFWSNQTNMTGLGDDVEDFQALIYSGVQEYVDALASVLPSDQTPLVAPIGLTYLAIYEDDPTAWEKLFVDDEMHASVHGSYVFATVLYATIYGHMPDQSVAIPNGGIENLFAECRKLLLDDDSSSSYYNNQEEEEDQPDNNEEDEDNNYYDYNLYNMANEEDNYNANSNSNSNSNNSPFPTASEARYYRNWARRVTLQGYVPGSLR